MQRRLRGKVSVSFTGSEPHCVIPRTGRRKSGLEVVWAHRGNFFKISTAASVMSTWHIQHQAQRKNMFTKIKRVWSVESKRVRRSLWPGYIMLRWKRCRMQGKKMQQWSPALTFSVTYSVLVVIIILYFIWCRMTPQTGVVWGGGEAVLVDSCEESVEVWKIIHLLGSSSSIIIQCSVMI